MDFTDTPEEAAFRAEARSWLEANAPQAQPTGRLMSMEDPEAVKEQQDWQALKADAGWACLTWPEEYGGRGANAIQNVIWNQEESRFRTRVNIFSIGLGMLGPTIMTHGTEAQKARHLRPMLRGEEIWCQLFSEPGAGSDVAGLRTQCVPDGDDWVCNGQKIWTSGAHYSRWGALVARTDPDAVKHAGISYFILDMESPGIEIRPIQQIDGGAGFSEVFFNDVRIPGENLVGSINDGWRCAITTLMNERASLGTSVQGLGVEALIELARNTNWQDGTALDDPGVRRRLADFFIRSKGLQYTGYRSLTAISRGATPGPEGSIGKLVGAPLGQEMASFAVDLQEESGAVRGADAALEGAWQASYMGSPAMRLAGGTDEILRNIVAERVLGLPSEMRADKGMAFREIPTGSDR
ncbi:acyl-CoA dehydrogenase family protein [Myxococcota bacterium]|nr:acyl-CoA dehydrogenase family protein [Myxococcota bacterium]